MLEARPSSPPSPFPLLGALATCALLALAPAAQQKAERQKPIAQPEPMPSRVGSALPVELDPKLGEAFQNNGSWYWGDLIKVNGASFVKAHLVDVNLRAGDVLVLRSATGTIVEEITGRGPKDRGTFWALSAFGEDLELEFHFKQPYAKSPFRIDQVIAGDPAILDQSRVPEDICSPENFDDVFCYQGDSGKWSNVMASVGVMSVGGNPVSALFCSGSNISPQNYVLTNQHCITSQADCDNSEFVFKFYRTGCNSGAPITTDWVGYRCNDVVATKPFVSCDQGLADLDYALCSVIGDPASTFGYANPDPVRLTDGEAIYIIQHPSGRPHEIAHGSGTNVDVDGTVLRYYNTLDTEPGSSGSPIFRESDDKLVGLHHCGGCTSAGVGNRGMLMADIYPDIASFLCTATVTLTGLGGTNLTEVAGDHDTIVEPGETWSFIPRVRNGACSLLASGVAATVVVAPSSTAQVTLLQSGAGFGDIAGGAVASATAPVVFKVNSSSPCGGTVVFDLVNLQAASGGPFPDAPAILSEPVGDEPFETLFFDDFSAPNGWSIVDGGTGSGSASTWTTANPGLRSLALTAPYYIADSDKLGSGQTMNEELISPVLSCAGFSSVKLQFTHVFHWYSGGQDEQCDVDVRSPATGGAWVTVANFQDADTSGTVSLDITAQAAGQGDVQIRFHYYNAVFEWWWAVDDVFVLGSHGFQCDVFSEVVTEPVTPGGISNPGRLRPPHTGGG